MPNDIPDWTSQSKVTLIGVAQGNLGDTSSPALQIDQGVASATGGGLLNGPAGAVLASFQPAAGSAIANRSKGAVATGNGGASPAPFSPATLSGSLLLAWVAGSTGSPTSVSAGWVKVLDVNPSAGLAAALWAKPNCGAAEAAPVFTNGALGGHFTTCAAVTAEFTGAAVSPNDQSGSATSTVSPLVVTAGAADVAFGDLVAMASVWNPQVDGLTTFVETFNNGAAAVHVGDTGANAGFVPASFCYGITSPPATGLPLGVAPWDYDASGTSGPAAGSQASVVLAATPGKIYRAAMLAASIAAAAATAFELDTQLLDGSTAIWQQNLAIQAAIGGESHYELSGLALKGTVGNSMTFKFSAAAGGQLERVNIGAYLR